MSHHCPAIVIGCMDWRLHDHLHKYMEEKFGHFDALHLAGGALTLLSPETKQLVLNQIGKSIELHGVQTVVPVGHEDCGAYGGKAAFDHDDEKERARHRLDLEKATAVIKEAFPKLRVVPVFELLDGSIIKL